MAKIKDALIDFNPWWKGKFSLYFKERELYKKLQKFISLPQIISITGLRRVGKTTLMLKLALDFLNKGFNPKNILYFSFDEFKDANIKEIINEYENITEKTLNTEKFLLLFDEIQKLDNWENQLKVIYDLHKGNVKMIISGSETLFIRKKSKETLAGRIFEFKLTPMSFKEFLDFKGFEFSNLSLYEKEISRLFNEFKLIMGFPELIGIKDKEIIKKYVKEGIIDKVIYRDISQIFNVKELSLIESILNIFMDNPGQIIEISKLAKELGSSRQTISNYLSYLEDSFLIKKLYNFSRNRRKTERKLKKFYPSLISVDLIFKEDDYSKSKVFEWLIVNQLDAGFFWRDSFKNEVDIILADKEIIPIEIKYGQIDFSGITAFMKKFNVKEGIILSSNIEEKKSFDNKNIKIIPAFKFLLKNY